MILIIISETKIKLTNLELIKSEKINIIRDDKILFK